jgi:hypothetical protein
MRRRDFVTLLGGASESTKNPSVRAGIDEYHSEASVLLPTSAVEQQAPGPWGLSREAPAMPVPSEPFATVYEDRNRLGVIVARIGRGGFEAYAADNHSLGLFPSPRKAAAAITTTRPWVVGALDLTVSNVVHPPSVHRQHLRRNPT